ncbi:MAG: peptidoglycan-binding domain-containing protein [Planctomycetota bacterium]
MDPGASFSGLQISGLTTHAALTSDNLLGTPFSQTGQLYFFADNNRDATRSTGRPTGDTDPLSPGFQGTLNGQVTIDGVVRTFQITVRPGHSGTGRGAVTQAFEDIGDPRNVPLNVARQQQRLAYLGFEAQGGGLPRTTGTFDAGTDEALRTFQAVFVGGVNTTQVGVDGIIGPNTAGWLNAANAPRWEELVDPDPQTPGTFSVGSMIGDFDILPARDPGTGVRSGLTPQTERFANSWTVDLVEAGSAAARDATGRTQLVNALSTFDGYGSSCCHSTHRVGTDLDLHVDVSAWNFGNGFIDSEEQKVIDHARAFLNLTGLDGRVARILVSNQDILNGINATHPGVAVFDSSGVHLNHLHLDIVPTGRVADTPDAPGDFNLDDDVNADDIDLLFKNLDGDTSVYNLAGSAGVVNGDDVDHLVNNILGTNYGDADLSGFVFQSDLNAVLLNWGDTNAGWATGSFDGDGAVGQADLNAVLLNWGAAGLANAAVPEPVGPATVLTLTAAMGLRRRAHDS